MTAKKTAEQEVVQKGKVLTGVVVSTKMKDTIVVAVSRFVKHPKYHKFVKRVKRYHAHDAGNTVNIVECRPISKTKHFTVA